MATQGGNDGIIDVPSNGGSVTFTETPNGAVASANGPTNGVKGAVANNGQLTATGGSFNNSEWGVGSNSTLNFRNTALNNSSVTGNNQNNNVGFGATTPAPSLVAGEAGLRLRPIPGPRPAPGPRPTPGGQNTTSSNVQADLRGGADSISFANRSTNRSSNFNLGTGADSITFSSGSKTISTTVDLGIDNDVDSVIVDKLNDVSGVVINNFGANDTLKIGGRTFNAAEVEARDGKFGRNNLTVNLD